MREANGGFLLVMVEEARELLTDLRQCDEVDYLYDGCAHQQSGVCTACTRIAGIGCMNRKQGTQPMNRLVQLEKPHMWSTVHREWYVQQCAAVGEPRTHEQEALRSI